MHLLYTPHTQISFLSYRAHALCANMPFYLTRRLWPSCHSDMGGSWHGWRFLLEQTDVLQNCWFISTKEGSFSLATLRNVPMVNWSRTSFFPQHLARGAGKLEVSWRRRQLQSRQTWSPRLFRIRFRILEKRLVENLKRTHTVPSILGCLCARR